MSLEIDVGLLVMNLYHIPSVFPGLHELDNMSVNFNSIVNNISELYALDTPVPASNVGRCTSQRPTVPVGRICFFLAFQC